MFVCLMALDKYQGFTNVVVQYRPVLDIKYMLSPLQYLTCEKMRERELKSLFYYTPRPQTNSSKVGIPIYRYSQEGKA
jgi:hypothetical protein